MSGKRYKSLPLLFRKYHKELTAFGGLQPLARATKKPLKKVKQWAEKQLAYTLHKPVRLNYKRNPVLLSARDEIWQSDLGDLLIFRKENRGYKYLLTVIDVFSKSAWVVPLKTKSAKTIKQASEGIFDQGRKPQKIHTDRGGEFMGGEVQD